MLRSRRRKCASPACPLLANTNWRKYGGYCCHRCYYWEEWDKDGFHGGQCSAKRAPVGTPLAPPDPPEPDLHVKLACEDRKVEKLALQKARQQARRLRLEGAAHTAANKSRFEEDVNTKILGKGLPREECDSSGTSDFGFSVGSAKLFEVDALHCPKPSTATRSREDAESDMAQKFAPGVRRPGADQGSERCKDSEARRMAEREEGEEEPWTLDTVTAVGEARGEECQSQQATPPRQVLLRDCFPEAVGSAEAVREEAIPACDCKSSASEGADAAGSSAADDRHGHNEGGETHGSGHEEEHGPTPSGDGHVVEKADLAPTAMPAGQPPRLGHSPRWQALRQAPVTASVSPSSSPPCTTAILSCRSSRCQQGVPDHPLLADGQPQDPLHCGELERRRQEEAEEQPDGWLAVDLVTKRQDEARRAEAERQARREVRRREAEQRARESAADREGRFRARRGT
mmetsp:Transcript_24886/g.77367  ORF Transcript_24886/g.77367 Transcript_24886/m.77367 type:complete len:459 (-) Transcript_24886:37-1413(-)